MARAKRGSDSAADPMRDAWGPAGPPRPGGGAPPAYEPQSYETPQYDAPPAPAYDAPPPPPYDAAPAYAPPPPPPAPSYAPPPPASSYAPPPPPAAPTEVPDRPSWLAPITAPSSEGTAGWAAPEGAATRPGWAPPPGSQPPGAPGYGGYGYGPPPGAQRSSSKVALFVGLGLLVLLAAVGGGLKFYKKEFRLKPAPATLGAETRNDSAQFASLVEQQKASLSSQTGVRDVVVAVYGSPAGLAPGSGTATGTFYLLLAVSGLGAEGQERALENLSASQNGATARIGALSTRVTLSGIEYSCGSGDVVVGTVTLPMSLCAWSKSTRFGVLIAYKKVPLEELANVASEAKHAVMG